LELPWGDGSGSSWTPWATGLASSGETWGMFATALADFDCNGRLDLISQSFGSGNGLRLYENHGDGTWSQAWALTGDNARYTIETCDINADGYPDFVATRTGANVLIGDGDFGFTLNHNGLPAGTIMAIDTGDMNNDGCDDVVFTLGSSGILCYNYNKNDNNWVSASNGLPISGNYYMTQFGDLNGDGFLDIVAYSDPTGYVFLGDGDGNWVADTTWTMPLPGGYSALRVDGDIDHDGREDIVVQAKQSGFPFNRNQLRVYSPWLEPTELSVRVTMPHGGETFRSGSMRNIRWLSAVPVSQGDAMVDIKLSRNGESGPWVTIASNIPNNGCYQWIVAGAGSNNCRIKIILDTGSDNNYTISKSDFTILNGIQQYSITNLKSNWNFISVPFNNSINLSNITVSYNNTKYNWSEAVNLNIINNYLFSWNRISQTYTFSNTLEPGNGNWLYAYKTCELLIENITITSDDYITDIEIGWNIVGVPYNENVSKTDILVNDTDWDTAVGNGWISDFVFGWSRTGQNYNFADTLMPGYAYWMYAYQPCTLKRVV